MKAISLWQPWATAVALGSKRIETRHWRTNYRGLLAIHAAKRKNVSELIHYHSHWNWQGAMRGAGWTWGTDGRPREEEGPYIRSGYGLPFGAIVAICTLDDCRPTETFTQAELNTPRRPAGEQSGSYDWTERQMGNFDLGRFGWMLRNITPLPKPIPFTGMQGLFNVHDDLIFASLAVPQVPESSS